MNLTSTKTRENVRMLLLPYHERPEPSEYCTDMSGLDTTMNQTKKDQPKSKMILSRIYNIENLATHIISLGGKGLFFLLPLNIFNLEEKNVP